MTTVLSVLDVAGKTGTYRGLPAAARNLKPHYCRRAVAPLWHADLNDGIVVVLAPLRRLFAHHPAWSKELGDGWAKLAKGEYDWAQLALHIWPQRVIPKCADDRSMAIAQDIEDSFWAHDRDNPNKWHPRHTPTIVQLIGVGANPTVQTSRTQTYL